MQQKAYRAALSDQRVIDPSQGQRWLTLLALAVATALIFFIAVLGSHPTRAEAAGNSIKIELNKLEQTDKGCRFYWLVSNQSAKDLKELDMTFYWFQSDGVIGGDLRFAFAPAPSKSMKVKQYMLPEKTCSDFASLLVNTINQCTDSTGPVQDCATHLSYASRTSVEFLK